MRPWRSIAAFVGVAAAAPSCPSLLERPGGSASPLDGDCGGEALGLAQRQQRALLAPRAGGRRGAGPLPPIAFVKTHKTGGSTAVNIMHRLIEANNLRFVWPNDGGVINWELMEEPPAHQFDVVCNHQMFNETATRAYLKPSPFLFSIVRDPVGMTDSRFRWKATKQYQKVEETDTWAKRLDLMKQDSANYKNPLARDFGWYNGVDLRNVDIESVGDIFSKDKDLEAVQKFIDSLDKALDFVFPTERYDEGLILLRHKLGLGFDDVKYLRMKESESEPIAPITADETQKLQEWVSVDTAIFNHFNARFQRDWDAAGGDAVLGPEVKELQRRNEELSRACAEPRDEAACPEAFTMDNGEYSRRMGMKAMFDELDAQAAAKK